MLPEFRQAIFQLPLCVGNISRFTILQDDSLDQPSQFLSGSKREMMLNIQKLFVTMQEQDSRAISTEELTKTFGWGANNEQ